MRGEIHHPYQGGIKTIVLSEANAAMIISTRWKLPARSVPSPWARRRNTFAFQAKCTGEKARMRVYNKIYNSPLITLNWLPKADCSQKEVTKSLWVSPLWGNAVFHWTYRRVLILVLGFNYWDAILLLRGGREKGKHRASEGVCPRAAHKKEFPFPAGKGLKGWGVVHVLTKGKCIIIYGKRGDKILSPFRTKYSRPQSQVPNQK